MPYRSISNINAESAENPNQRSTSSNSVLQSSAQGFVNSAWEMVFLSYMIPELLKDHSRAKLFSEAVGEDVVAAALNLGQVLHSKQLSNGFLATNVPRSRSKRSYIKMDPDGQSPSLQSQDSLPDLPRIIDPSLEKAVFTHQGTLDRFAGINEGYERLEFLGDCYLEQIAGQLCYDLFPTYTPGRLSQFSQKLVANETLAEFSLAYKFDERTKLQRDYASNRKAWTKALADVFEAYSAAIILSYPQNGVTILEEWLKKLWAPRLNESNLGKPAKKLAKEELAQRIMSKGMRIEYREEAPPQPENGSAIIWYTMGVYFTGWTWKSEHLGTGKGLNMKEAGGRAAMEALLNPITAEIEATKKEHDAAIRLEREQQNSLAEESNRLVGLGMV